MTIGFACKQALVSETVAFDIVDSFAAVDIVAVVVVVFAVALEPVVASETPDFDLVIEDSAAYCSNPVAAVVVAVEVYSPRLCLSLWYTCRRSYRTNHTSRPFDTD